MFGYGHLTGNILILRIKFIICKTISEKFFSFYYDSLEIRLVLKVTNICFDDDYDVIDVVLFNLF